MNSTIAFSELERNLIHEVINVIAFEIVSETLYTKEITLSYRNTQINFSKGAENATSEKLKNYIVEKVFETKVENNSRKEGMKEISEGLRKVLLELDDIRKQRSPGSLIPFIAMVVSEIINLKHKSYHDIIHSLDCGKNCLAVFSARQIV